MAYTIKSIDPKTFDIVVSFDIDDKDQTIHAEKYDVVDENNIVTGQAYYLEDKDKLDAFLLDYETAYTRGINETTIKIDPSLKNLVK